MALAKSAAGWSLAALVVLGCGGQGVAPAVPRLTAVVEPGRPEFGTVALAGVPDAAPSEFCIYTAQAQHAEEPLAVLGTSTREPGGLRFRPRFPFLPGQAYVARYAPAGLELTFMLPLPPAGEPARVTAIYPTADVLPVNVLRLYVHFSQPMSRGGAADHLRLLRADGTPVEGAFAPGGAELWDAATTRLTVLLDPGRIKRGVGPHEEAGAPLAEGRGYRLVVDAAWPNGQGHPLAQAFEKVFRTDSPDREQPRLASWQLTSPATPSASLLLHFPEPLDHALLLSCLTVVGADGVEVAGTAEVHDGERQWVFRPERPWPPGRYELRVAQTLEDLAGNSLLRAFETASAAPTAPRGVITLSFLVP